MTAFILIAATLVSVSDSFDKLEWSHWNTPGADVRYERRGDVGRTKPGAAAIVVGAKGKATSGGCILRRFQVERGHEYTALAWVKADGFKPESGVSLALQGQNGRDEFIGAQVMSTKLRVDRCRDWARIALTLTVPKDGKWKTCEKLLVTVSAPGGACGTLYVDDFEFFETEDDE